MEISTWDGRKATLLTAGKLPNSQLHMTPKSELEMIEDDLKSDRPEMKSYLASVGAVEGDTAEDILQKVKKRDEEFFADIEKYQSEEWISQQGARQRAKTVHSVFRDGNGEIMGFLRENGGMTSTNALGSLIEGVAWTGSDDEYAAKVKKLGEQFYGSVQVDTYPPGSGITVGMAGDEMFGRGPRIPPPSATGSETGSETGNETGRTGTGYTPRRGYSAETLTLFQEARNTYGRGRF